MQCKDLMEAKWDWRGAGPYDADFLYHALKNIQVKITYVPWGCDIDDPIQIEARIVGANYLESGYISVKEKQFTHAFDLACVKSIQLPPNSKSEVIKNLLKWVKTYAAKDENFVGDPITVLDLQALKRVLPAIGIKLSNIDIRTIIDWLTNYTRL